MSRRRFRTRIPFTFLGGGRGGGGGGIDGPRDGYPWPFPPSSSQDPTERASGSVNRSSPQQLRLAQPIHRFLHCSFHVVIVTVRDSFTGWKGGKRGTIEFLYRTVLLRLSCSCRWQNPTPIGIGLLSLPLMRLRWEEERRRKALELGSFILSYGGERRAASGIRASHFPYFLALPPLRPFGVSLCLPALRNNLNGKERKGPRRGRCRRRRSYHGG